MKIFYIICSLIVVFWLISLAVGDGAFKKKFTMSGIVEIDVANKKANCFVDADAHGISCLPKWFIEGTK